MARRTAAENAEALFELYEQKMYRIAYAILHDEGQAEDAVIAAFEKILKSDGVPRRPQGKAAERLVVTAVRSAAIDQYRMNIRDRRYSVLTDDVAECLAPEALACETPIDDHLQQAHAQSLVDGLPEAYGSVLRERFLRDRTVRQTAACLGISEASVRKRQERALKMLRNEKGGLEHEIPCV